MAINQISLSNTFGQLVTTASALVAVANNLTDGPQFNSNATIVLTNPGVGLNVLNTAIINVANITVLNAPTINVTQAYITTANITTANITLLTGTAVDQFDPSGLAVVMALALG